MKESVIILICLLVICVGIGSCIYSNKEKTARAGKYEVTTIEGCQYFMCPAYYGYFTLAHKGNCTNSIHGR